MGKRKVRFYCLIFKNIFFIPKKLLYLWYKKNIMQEKESKTNTHFRISIVKSLLRIAGCYALFTLNFPLTAILLCAAEILGIAEEIF